MPFDYLTENEHINQRCAALSITPTHRRLIVSIYHQELALVCNATVQRTFSISTSKNPPSCIENSFGTPLGLHALADKIGDAAPLGMVFKGRIPTGRLFPEFSEEEQRRNLITTRIIRLRGLEPGYNSGNGCDSYDRYIYIHGTNHENRIGEAFSSGCIEMLNAEIIELFNITKEGDLVSICSA